MRKALESCSVWTAKGKWESCKNIQIRQGDQKLRNKHRMEKEKVDKFSRLSKHPQVEFSSELLSVNRNCVKL